MLVVVDVVAYLVIAVLVNMGEYEAYGGLGVAFIAVVGYILARAIVVTLIYKKVIFPILTFAVSISLYFLIVNNFDFVHVFSSNILYGSIGVLCAILFVPTIFTYPFAYSLKKRAAEGEQSVNDTPASIDTTENE